MAGADELHVCEATIVTSRKRLIQLLPLALKCLIPRHCCSAIRGIKCHRTKGRVKQPIGRETQISRGDSFECLSDLLIASFSQLKLGPVPLGSSLSHVSRQSIPWM